MNKYVLSIALLVASTGAFAQNRLVKKAQGLINNNQIEEAQTLLTEALNSGETKDMALAWDVQGDLYQKAFCRRTEQSGCSPAFGYGKVC